MDFFDPTATSPNLDMNGLTPGSNYNPNAGFTPTSPKPDFTSPQGQQAHQNNFLDYLGAVTHAMNKGGSGGQPQASGGGNFHPSTAMPNNSGALMSGAMSAMGGAGGAGAAGGLAAL